MEELGALLALAQEANAQLGDIKSTATTSLSAIATATTGFLKNGRHSHGFKGECGRMFTKRQAATMVQNAWRRKVARREIQRMIREQWQKFKDKKVRQVLLYERSNWPRHLDKTKNLGGQRYRKNIS